MNHEESLPGATLLESGQGRNLDRPQVEIWSPFPQSGPSRMDISNNKIIERDCKLEPSDILTWKRFSPHVEIELIFVPHQCPPPVYLLSITCATVHYIYVCSASQKPTASLMKNGAIWPPSATDTTHVNYWLPAFANFRQKRSSCHAESRVRLQRTAQPETTSEAGFSAPKLKGETKTSWPGHVSAILAANRRHLSHFWQSQSSSQMRSADLGPLMLLRSRLRLRKASSHVSLPRSWSRYFFFCLLHPI